MPFILPPNGYFNSGITNGAAKNAQDEQLGFLRQSILGAADRTAEVVAIVGGSLPVTQPTHTMDTEAQASNDVLDRVDITEMSDGQLLLLRITDNGRVVTVTHGAGGIGQILLHRNVNFVMNSTKMWLQLRLEGTDLVENWRSYGDDQAAGRTALGLGNVATLDVGDGLTDDGAGNLDAQVEAAGGISVSPTGLALAINALASSISPLPSDQIALDKGAGNDLRMTLLNMLKVIDGLTEETAPDAAADSVVVYSAANSAVRKVLLDNLGGGGLKPLGSASLAGQTAVGFTGLDPAAYSCLILVQEDVEYNASVDSQSNWLQVGDGSYHTGNNYATSGRGYRVGTGAGTGAEYTVATKRGGFLTVAPNTQARSAPTVFRKNQSIVILHAPGSVEGKQITEFFGFITSDADPYYSGHSAGFLQFKTRAERLRVIPATAATPWVGGTVSLYGMVKP